MVVAILLMANLISYFKDVYATVMEVMFMVRFRNMRNILEVRKEVKE